MTYSIEDLQFPVVAGKEVTARFDGGDLTTDGGLLLVQAADRRLNLVGRIYAALKDSRQQSKVEHTMEELVRSRIYAICLGYADANDFDTLRTDPALKIVCGRAPRGGNNLATQPTLSRLENSFTRRDLFNFAEAIGKVAVSRVPVRSKVVIIDIDPTDDPCHGQQELSFYNPFYRNNCYMPILFHVSGSDGRKRLVTSILRPGNTGLTTGFVPGLARIVKLVRSQCPKATVIVRADSAFGIDEIMRFCEQEGLQFVLGLRSNQRVDKLAESLRPKLERKVAKHGEDCRVYGSFEHKAGNWPHPRRLVVKAEMTQGKFNPRQLITNMSKTSRKLYEFYCQRGDQENRIKELKLDLQSGRTSCHRFLANQFRLLLHVAAHVLMDVIQMTLNEALRRTLKRAG